LLEKANGEYFMWAADDDWWAPGFVEIIMNELIAHHECVAGHPDFIAVDEANNKITSYPDFLPLLQEFAINSDIKRVTNFINQYEGFGKANLFYSIFKTSALRTKQVAALLKEGNLPCDMLIVLSVLLQGNIAIIPQLLRSCTTENVKHYSQVARQDKLVNVGIAYINTGGISATHKKWGKYLYDHFKLVNNSDFSFVKKLAIYPVVIKKILLFYFDVFCYNVRLRGYDVFSKFRRKYHLN